MKFTYLLFIVPLLLFSCKKKNTDTNTAGANDFAYSVSHNPVIEVPANSIYNFSFNIKVLSGSIADNKLTCFIDGLPVKVTASPDSILVGQLLGGVFSLDVGIIALGEYPFQLKIRSAKYGLQTYSVTLRIVSPPDFAPLLAGVYDSCYDYCPGPGFTYYPSTASTVADTPFLLKLSNVRGMGTGVIVRAWISNTVVVPYQEVAGVKIWGSGTYAQDGRPGHGGDYVMSVKDTIVTGTDTVGCTMHIEH